MDPLFMSLPGIDHQELAFLQGITKDLTEHQHKQFFMIYQGRRRDPQMILILTLLGFIGVAGVQRMLTNEIGLGIVYLLTGGICMIGTIVDLVNHKKIAFTYNQQVAMESVSLAKMIKE